MKCHIVRRSLFGSSFTAAPTDAGSKLGRPPRTDPSGSCAGGPWDIGPPSSAAPFSLTALAGLKGDGSHPLPGCRFLGRIWASAPSSHLLRMLYVSDSPAQSMNNNLLSLWARGLRKPPFPTAGCWPHFRRTRACWDSGLENDPGSQSTWPQKPGPGAPRERRTPGPRQGATETWR